MAVAEAVSMALIILGVILFLISFTNVEMITGLWSEGKIKRDRQFVESGQFGKRVYWILRLAGFALFAAGFIWMQFLD